MKLHKLYAFLADVLALDTFTAEKRSSVINSIQQLRSHYRESTFNVDYGHSSIQEAYLISYYPYYVDQLPTILEELYKQKNKDRMVGQHCTGLFFRSWTSARSCGLDRLY